MPRAPVTPGHEPADAPALVRVDDHFLGRFTAMGGPCEVLVDTEDRARAEAVVAIAAREALRIEHKYSRYREDNLVHRINHSAGQPVRVDEETELLLGYAAACHEMSDGLFDITSGALRRAWTFDGGERVPTEDSVREALRHVGWQKATWSDSVLVLPEGMEIDLGGVAKEYAVDRAAALISPAAGCACLVNFGGDIYAGGARQGGRAWGVGVEDPEHIGGTPLYRVDLSRGGLATSGDARRFVLSGGKRLGHILDPRTGRPVENAPRSVTVLAGTCVEAGTLSTLACLKGRGARGFLEQQGVEFRIVL